MAICQQDLRVLVDVCLKRAQAVLYPPVCVLCSGNGRPGQDLCAGCEGDLPLNSMACRRCAQPLAGVAAAASVCGACLRRPPLFDASFVPFQYAYPMTHLLHSLKYRGRLACGRVLGVLLARHFIAARSGELPECILPVPLAERRYRERGYNQAIELGASLAQTLRIPMRTDIVVRVRNTREQAELSGRERRRNVRDAFRAQGTLPARHVAILDDVVTTGSTVNELAKTLRRAGASRIEVWAVARAARRQSFTS